MWRFWKRRRRRTAGCRACGICCEIYGHDLRVAVEDLERWRAQGRLDLLGRVGEGGVLWCDPVTGERLVDCPYLRRTGDDEARCSIHGTKPHICRAYPTGAHGYRCVRGLRFGEG